MREVSPAETERQIRREGARHGLFPVHDAGRCYVGQRERHLVNCGEVDAVVERVVPICSVTMDKPLGNVWKSRVQRYEYEHAKVYRAANARREAAARAVAEDRYRQRVRELKRLERIWGKQEIVIAAAEALGGLRQAGG